MALSAILFDLDNTLYPASSGLMEHVDTRITEYVQNRLSLSPEEVAVVRRTYLAEYGTTLRGLQHNYQIDHDDYLNYVHDLALERFLKLDATLDQMLSEIPVTKAIFTNSPIEHARRVLDVLGIAHHFSHIFDARFFAFRPKPDPMTYQIALDTLGVTGPQTALLEDTARNLPPARELGMTTILIGSPATDDRISAAQHVVADIITALEILRPLCEPAYHGQLQ